MRTELFAKGFSFSGYEREMLAVNLGDGHFADVSGVSGIDSVSDGRGAVFIYEATESDDDRDPIAVVQSLDIGSGDEFGSSVAVYGDDSSLTLVAGAPNKDDGSGAAYVFTGIGESWLQEAQLVVETGLSRGDQFGYAIDLHGNTAVVGAEQELGTVPDVRFCSCFCPGGSLGAAYKLIHLLAITWVVPEYSQSLNRPGLKNNPTNRFD